MFVLPGSDLTIESNGKLQIYQNKLIICVLDLDTRLFIVNADNSKNLSAFS